MVGCLLSLHSSHSLFVLLLSAKAWRRKGLRAHDCNDTFGSAGSDGMDGMGWRFLLHYDDYDKMMMI